MITDDGVGIRPIHTNNFDPSKKIGYLINPKLLEQSLSEYELVCVKTKRKLLKTICKNKNEVIGKNFWTPDYCFIGSYLSQTNSNTVSLNELTVMMVGASKKSKAKAVNSNFNKHFPKQDKTYHYNHRLKSLNEPAAMFVKGVKFVAAVLYQCEYLKRVGALEEYLVLYELIKASGMAVLIDDRVMQQMSRYEPYYRFDLGSIEGDALVTRPTPNKELLPKIVATARQINEPLDLDTHVVAQSPSSSRVNKEYSGSPAPVGEQSTPTPTLSTSEARESSENTNPPASDTDTTAIRPQSNQLLTATEVSIKIPPQTEDSLDENVLMGVGEGDLNKIKTEQQQEELTELIDMRSEGGGYTDMRTLLKNKQINSGFNIQTPSDDEDDSAKQINEDYVNVGKTLKQVLSQE